MVWIRIRGCRWRSTPGYNLLSLSGYKEAASPRIKFTCITPRVYSLRRILNGQKNRTQKDTAPIFLRSIFLPARAASSGWNLTRSYSPQRPSRWIGKKNVRAKKICEIHLPVVPIGLGVKNRAQIGSTLERDFDSSTTTRAPDAKSDSCCFSAAINISIICPGRTFWPLT